MLYSTGCTDYGQEIDNLNQKVDQIENDLRHDYDGKINSLSAKLDETKEGLEALVEKEISDLSAKHDADIKALEDAYKAADSALEASLQKKIDDANAAIVALEKALADKAAELKAAQEAGDAALATQIEQAKKEAADKAEELNNKIIALESKLDTKAAELKAAQEAGDAALQAKLDAEVTNLENQLDTLTSQMNALSQELTQKITDCEQALLKKLQDLEDALEDEIGELREDMQSKVDAANEAIAEAQDDIEGLDIRVGQTENDIQAVNEEVKALQEMLTIARAELEATIKAGDDALAAELISAKEALAKAIADGDAALAATLEQEVTTLENAIAAGDQALAVKLAEAKEELAQAIADGDAALAASLQQAIATLEGQIKALEEATNVKIKALEEQIAALEEQLEAKIAQLQQQDLLFAQQLAVVEADLAALAALVDARYEELVASISALEIKLQAQIDQNKRDIAQNAANIAELVKDLATTQSALEDLTDSVANLEVLLYKNYEEFVNFQAIVEGEIAALKAGLVLLQASYNEIVGEIIPGLENQIAENKALIEKNIADLAEDEAIFNAYREATNNTLELLLATDAALQTILTSVCDDIYNIYGELATLTSAIVDVQAECQQQLADCYAYINQLAASYDKSINSLTALQAQQQAQMEMMLARMSAYEGYFAAITSSLENEINERKAADARVSEALTTLTAKYDALESKYDARCAELADSIVSLATEFAEYKVEVQHTIDAVLLVLRQEIAVALKNANDYTDQEIASLDAKLTDKLDKAVVDLNTRISNVESELRALIKETEDKLRTEMNEIKYDLNDHIQNILKALEVVNGRLDSAEGRLDSAEERLAIAEDKIQENFEFFLSEVNDIRAELSNINTRIDNANVLINTLRAEFESYRMQMENELADLKNAYTELINNEIATLREDIQEQIDLIVSRVQSIVFVPKYTDGKGTINFAKAGDTVVESRSQATYQVYPASCADAIVLNFGKESQTLEFNHEYLETRSALSFDVVAVEKGAKDGQIVVTFEPRGLDAEFYAGTTEKEYALSLVLTTEKVNLSSAYTNFVRAKKADAISMNIMLGDKAISGLYGQTVTFEYTDTKTVEKVLPEHYVAFTVAGKTYYGIKALNAAGYALTMERSNYINRSQPNLGTRPFDVKENEEGVLEVKVNEVNGTLIANFVDFGYTYVAGTLKAEAFSRYATSLVKSDVKFNGETATWTYDLDAVVDAANDGAYSREFELTLTSHDLPSDVDLNMVFANAPDSVKVMLDGKEAEVDAEFFVKNDKIYLNFANFEWGKSYDVVATYTVLDKVLNDPCAEATVTVNVVTVDRTREVIKVELADSKWELTKRFVNESRTAKESLMQIYDDAKSYLGDMTAEDFLEDIFVNHKFDYKNSANGQDKGTDDTYTKLVIVDEGTMIQSVYNIDEYKEEIPEAIEYFYHITTWYGQEIEITKTLSIGLKPVEITLAAEPVEIEKNLQFATYGQSLAAIFENVTNVKKDEFTADEYLKAIFVDFVTRGKSYSANGAPRTNTRLAVDQEKPSTAITTYNYVDFVGEAPMSVTYKTTYTTWYGQEITINQVVDFEYPAYDFKHNSKYVYGADSDYYSQVQPEYTWKNDNEAEGLLKFDVAAVDLRAAFAVVDAEANKFTAEQLVELGLEYNFEIEDKDHNGIEIDPLTDKLSYYGANPYVNVRGNLYIVNDNDTYYTVPTSFDEGGKYESYNVVKFNPIGTAEVIKNPTIDVNNAKAYNVHVLDYVKLMDHRMGGRQDWELITNGAWVVGNGQNGFAQGVDVRADYIYRITEVWVNDTSDVDADIRPYVTLNNGTLTFDNSQQLELTAPFTVPVTLKFQNCWMEKPQQVTVKVTFNPIK